MTDNKTNTEMMPDLVTDVCCIFTKCYILNFRNKKKKKKKRLGKELYQDILILKEQYLYIERTIAFV